MQQYIITGLTYYYEENIQWLFAAAVILGSVKFYKIKNKQFDVRKEFKLPKLCQVSQISSDLCCYLTSRVNWGTKNPITRQG